MRNRSLTVPLAILALTAACTQPAGDAAPVDAAAVTAAMDALREKHQAAELAGDTAAIGPLHHDDSSIDFQGAPAMRGRDAIVAGFAAGVAMGKPEVVEYMPTRTIALSNSQGSQLGTFHSASMMNGARTHMWGRYAVGASKDSAGTWKLNFVIGFTDSMKVDK